jgi:hypothetical protein
MHSRLESKFKCGAGGNGEFGYDKGAHNSENVWWESIQYERILEKPLDIPHGVLERITLLVSP